LINLFTKYFGYGDKKLSGFSAAALGPKGEGILPLDKPDIKEQVKAKVGAENHGGESDGAKILSTEDRVVAGNCPNCGVWVYFDRSGHP
jgi:hypothetical protein